MTKGPPHQGDTLTPAEIRKQLKGWARLAGRTYRLCTSLGVADVFAAIGFAYGLAHVLASFTKGGNGLSLSLICLGASLLLRAVLGYINQKLSLDAARDVVKTVRMGLIAELLKGRGAGDRHKPYFTTLFEDTEALEGYYARFLPIQVQSAIAPLIILVAVAFASPACALILSATLIPFVALMIVVGMASAEAARQQFSELARLSNLFSDRIRAMALILSFDDAPRQTQRLAGAAQSVSKRTLSVLKVAFTSSAVLEFFAALSLALVAVYCGFYLLHQLPFKVPVLLDFRNNAFESAFFCLAISVEFYAPMRRLSAAYHENQQATAACERLIIFRAYLTPAESETLSVSAPPSIEFKAVTCTFADDPDFHIGPVSFTAVPGEVVALSGMTGSGKSTLLRRLLGGSHKDGPAFGGDILIEGQRLGDHADLSASIAWMSQATPIIAGTLRDNLMLACRSATPETLDQVIESAGLKDLIASRTDGLDHNLDERGSGLSGGERRRIGLARALLKLAPILILDEPTADLDVASEAALIAGLKTAFAGRTVLMATHSDALLALADKVVTL